MESSRNCGKKEGRVIQVNEDELKKHVSEIVREKGQNSRKDRHGEEYFKLYNACPRWDAGKIARISFRRPAYIAHRADGGKKVWTYSFEQGHTGNISRISFKEPKCDFKYKGKEIWSLNTEEKHYLMNTLQAKNTTFHSELTTWQVAILTFNMEKGIDWNETKENLLSSGTLKYPEYLPFDLPIPNYMEL